MDPCVVAVDVEVTGLVVTGVVTGDADSPDDEDEDEAAAPDEPPVPAEPCDADGAGVTLVVVVTEVVAVVDVAALLWVLSATSTASNGSRVRLVGVGRGVCLWTLESLGVVDGACDFAAAGGGAPTLTWG